MGLSFFESIVKFLENIIESPIEFFHTHYQNPIMWLAFLFVGLAVFNATYNALEKDR